MAQCKFNGAIIPYKTLGLALILNEAEADLQTTCDKKHAMFLKLFLEDCFKSTL